MGSIWSLQKAPHFLDSNHVCQSLSLSIYDYIGQTRHTQMHLPLQFLSQSSTTKRQKHPRYFHQKNVQTWTGLSFSLILRVHNSDSHGRYKGTVSFSFATVGFYIRIFMWVMLLFLNWGWMRLKALHC